MAVMLPIFVKDKVMFDIVNVLFMFGQNSKPNTPHILRVEMT